MSDDVKTTDYLVLAVVGEADADRTGEAAMGRFGPTDWALEMWREAAVLSVPMRTTRATVIEEAKAKVAPLVGETAEQVRVRVVPMAEVTEAVVAFASDPQLVATIVRPGDDSDVPAPGDPSEGDGTAPAAEAA